MSRLSTRVFVPLSVLAVLACATPALANKSKGKLQVGVGTPVFTSHSFTETREVSGDDVETKVTGSEWGVQRRVTGELGYGMGDVAVFGVLFELGGASQKLEADDAGDSDASSFDMMFAPKLDIMLRAGKTVRPFFTLGVGYASGWVDDEGASVVPDFTASYSGLRFIGRLGARLFAGKTFSFDPAFVFQYQRDTITREFGNTGEFESKSAGYSMGLSFGFSGWLL